MPTQPLEPADLRLSQYDSIPILITVLHPAPIRLTQLIRWEAIKLNMKAGKTAAARKVMFALVGKTMELYTAGSLLDPPGRLTTAAGVSSLTRLLFGYVGYGGASLPAIDPAVLTSTEYAATVVADTGGVVVTNLDHAAVAIPDAAVNEPILVTISLKPQSLCLPGTTLVQAKGCWEIVRYPAGAFLTPVLAETCVDPSALTQAQSDSLRLHKYNTTEGLTALPPATPTHIDCTGFTVALSRVAPAGLYGLWRRAADAAMSWLSPEPLSAAAITPPPKGLGGMTGSFSDFFGAVPAESFVGVSADSAHTCGLTTTGAAYCWGENDAGQVSGSHIPPLVVEPVPRAVTGGLTFTSLTTGGYHSCGLTTPGAAYCWGNNFVGQLGVLEPYDTTLPGPVAGALTFSSLSAGRAHTCGLTAAGTAYCWGSNFFGQLGIMTGSNQPTPSAVADGHTFASLSAGAEHTCGLTPAGSAYCWGWNAAGQLGIGTTVDTFGPATVTLPAGVTFTSITAGWAHTCGLTAAGAAWCWGLNGSGQVGDSTTTDRLTPTLVSGGLVFTRLSAGGDHTCGLTAAGAGYCWGSNGYGALGDGTTTNRLVPRAVIMPSGVTFARLDAGEYHTCAVTLLATAWCWGLNGSGQLGDGTTTDRLTPTAVTP